MGCLVLLLEENALPQLQAHKQGSGLCWSTSSRSNNHHGFS